MQIKLNQMKLRNFKGLKLFDVALFGENVIIKAENGVGKTTVFDAFLWLLFGKDSTGRTDFELRPLDSDNQPIKGLVVSVEADIECAGTVHTFKKEHHEKVVKDQLRGYETLCWIDDVPKKISEYSAYIAELIDEETFKLLTDLNHFNGKMHWTERRKVLLDIAGEIGTPKGFKKLLATLNGRTVDEYKKVMADQKKRLEKERDEINPRIDEKHRGLDEYAGTDTSDVEAKREAMRAEITELDANRKLIFASETERQVKIEETHQLEKRRLAREAELKSDTGAIKDLLAQKARLDDEVAVCEMAVRQIKVAKDAAALLMEHDAGKMNAATALLDKLRADRKSCMEEPAADTCPTCKQKLPQHLVTDKEELQKAVLEDINKRGRTAKQEVATHKAAVETREAELQRLEDELKTAEFKLTQAETCKVAELVKLDEQIKSKPTPPPEQDAAWQGIAKQIAAANAEIGKPLSEQLQTIDESRTGKVNELDEINKALAQADRMKQDKARIAELEKLEQKLAQQLAGIEKQLADIGKYKAAESQLVETAVNGKFDHTEFKLFDELLNGSFEECCEATLNGVPYKGMSTGERIFVGVDIVNVLSAHYVMSVPLFIDHSESLTMPLGAHSQTIELFAAIGVDALKVEAKKGETSNV